ncbi:MAG: hypothetical protein JJ956_00875 [Pseudomonadales bacterium]|nr:hypothetical protein [Pseudomonadales bacterium]
MRILVIKPSSMGDIIHGQLTAESTYARIPEVMIDWVARKEFAPLVEAAEFADHV